jgi:hypothetical protein
MLNELTMEKLYSMRLAAMAAAWQQQTAQRIWDVLQKLWIAVDRSRRRVSADWMHVSNSSAGGVCRASARRAAYTLACWPPSTPKTTNIPRSRRRRLHSQTQRQKPRRVRLDYGGDSAPAQIHSLIIASLASPMPSAPEDNGIRTP